MENDPKRPTLILATGAAILLVGGFLFSVYVGTSGRTMESFAKHISFHSAYAAASGYLAEAKGAGAAIKYKTDHFMSSFFEEPGTAEAARYAEASRRENENDDEGWRSAGSKPDSEEGDSFGKSYGQEYGGGSGGDASMDESGGGGSSFSSGTEGQGAATHRGAVRGKPQGAPAGGLAAAGNARNSAFNQRPAFGGPASGHSGGPGAAASKLYASLPANGGGESAAPQYGKASRGSGIPARNKLNAMAGSQAKGAGDLNGATEKASGGGQSSFNASMSGGASSIGGGSSGGSAPAASGPSAAPGGGASAAGGTAISAAAPASGYAASGQEQTAQGNDDLIQSVVTDKQNGKDAKYLSADDATAKPDEDMLKSGAAASEGATKDFTDPDPENLNDLSAERKLELKTDLQVFMKKVENMYGAASDIKTTPCTSTPDVCKAHGVTGNYLTMNTEGGARLDLGLKYINTRWCQYTIDFQKPAK